MPAPDRVLLGLRVQDLGFRVQGLKFRVSGLTFRVQGGLGSLTRSEYHSNTTRVPVCDL